jgi:hypothetical protein
MRWPTGLSFIPMRQPRDEQFAHVLCGGCMCMVSNPALVRQHHAAQPRTRTARRISCSLSCVRSRREDSFDVLHHHHPVFTGANCGDRRCLLQLSRTGLIQIRPPWHGKSLSDFCIAEINRRVTKRSIAGCRSSTLRATITTMGPTEATTSSPCLRWSAAARVETFSDMARDTGIPRIRH